MHRSRWLAVLALLLGASVSRADAPEDVLKSLSDAVKKTDAEAVLDIFVPQFRSFFETEKKGYDLDSRFRKAAEDAFGKDDRPVRPDPMAEFKEDIKRIKSIVYKDKKEIAPDLVELKVEMTMTRGGMDVTRQESMYAIKIKDRWRLLPGGIRNAKTGADALKHLEEEAGREKKRTEEAAKLIEQVIKDVNAKKFKTRAEADKAFREVRFGSRFGGSPTTKVAPPRTAPTN